MQSNEGDASVQANHKVAATTAAAPPTSKDQAPTTLYGWPKILDAMRNYDARMGEAWKLEMDNLLIFGTLLAAVVTAFVIESNKLLDPTDLDPGGSDLEALNDISAQLSSFSVNTAFVNSTHTLNKRETDPAPTSNVVRVNTLWFLSLTLAVISTFFAIAVQQWLRHIPLPAYIPMREAVRLRQLRYSGMIKWQVPTIISMLPALVQIALVLFIVGLIEFINSMNADVALPFTVVSSVAFALFVVVSLAPLIRPSCPYKSPLVHITWELAWLGSAIAAYVIMIPITTLLDCFANTKRTRLSRIANYISFWTQRILIALQPPTTETSRMWTSRELAESAEKDNVPYLDRTALSWALTAGPTIDEVQSCLQDLIPEDRTACVLDWISLKLEGHMDIYRLLKDGIIDQAILSQVNSLFSENYRDLLMQVLSKGWPETDSNDQVYDRMTDPSIPHVLMFIWAIVQQSDKTLESYKVDFMKELKTICWNQRLDVEGERTWRGWNVACRVPAVLLFNCYINRDETQPHRKIFSASDVTQFLKWAESVAGLILDAQLPDDPALLWITPQELILSSSAVALHAAVGEHSAMRNRQFRVSLQSLLEQLTKLCGPAKDHIQAAAHPWEKLDRRLKDSESLEFVVANAIISISKSLAALADPKSGCLPLEKDDSNGDKPEAAS
ncbi:hypothetical protein EW026_g5693 [Hermanssonia centrifuga]|uniref:DUF6535 domain-containing protein n=1 Tax=Hermanssonia centrifuga TaxID=98765 RepID=A0A4S4KDA7_9APHY|nr:hypothetical protein EW026_g5693 [Hermanssonia centrifuga]